MVRNSEYVPSERGPVRSLLSVFPGWAPWAIGAFILMIVLSSLNPFNTVPTGSRGVVTRFGQIIGIEPEGLVLLPPWEHLSIFSIRAERADIEKAVANTNDQQPVDTALTVRYSIKPDQVSFVYEKYSHDGDLSSYVQTATMEVFKAVAANYSAPDLIAKRALVSSDIYAALQLKLDKYGANVINIDMRSFEFNGQYMKAINDKVFQEQQRLVAENRLKTVEAEQKSNVAIATASAESVKAKADGDAYAIKANADATAYDKLANATAEAKSLQLQNQAIASSKDVLELRRIEVELVKAHNWKGEFPQNMYGSVPLPFMNVTPGH